MLAVSCVSLSANDPLSGLRVGEIADPTPREGWTTVDVKAAALNHHDVWSLRGVGLSADRLPMVLGCDAAGIDEEGNEVIIHAVIASPTWRGDETLDPNRSIFSEHHQGLMSERALVPKANLVPKPAGMSWETASCLPVAYLTAYRMIFEKATLPPGSLMLVQGAGGGVNTAAIQMAVAAGIRVWVTSRSAEKRERALAMGVEAAFESGARLPEKVDAVIDNVGDATWSHSINVLRPGGALVTCGATTGHPKNAELTKIFFRQLKVLGSTVGTREQLVQLARFIAAKDIVPVIDEAMPLADAKEGFARMIDGDIFGKIVFTV